MQNNYELLEVVKITRKHSAYTTKNRDFGVLSYRLKGTANFYQDSVSCIANTDNVLFIPPDLNYSQIGEEEELIAIHFRCKKTPYADICVIKPFNMPLVKDLFKRLYRIFDDRNFGYEFKANSIFYEILYNLFKEGEQADSIISKSVEYIGKNYRNSDLTLKNIAIQSNISEVYFRKLFKNKYGKTPVRYINEQRVSYACSLLRGNYLTIDETAYESGFNNSKYFSKVFSEIIGTTPAKYRKTGF